MALQRSRNLHLDGDLVSPAPVPPGSATLQRGFWSRAGAWRSQGKPWSTGSGFMKQHLEQDGELQGLRRDMQMVFQDPFTSLNPRMTLLDIVGEPLLVHGMKSRRGREERVAELLKMVGLRPEYMRPFPHAFSGGAATHQHGPGLCPASAPGHR